MGRGGGEDQSIVLVLKRAKENSESTFFSFSRFLFIALFSSVDVALHRHWIVAMHSPPQRRVKQVSLTKQTF